MNFRKIMLKSGTGIILGKDENSNDYLMNDFKGKENVILHTVMPGSPFGVIDKLKPTKQEVYEAGIFVARYSQYWRDNKKDVKVSVFTGKDAAKENGMKPGLWQIKKSKMITIKKEDIIKIEKENKKENKKFLLVMRAARHCKLR
jgi:predicted ribosome quality control (RQC) complex YloA/Tae2 family protein